MVKLGLLPSNLHDDRNKCEINVKTKLTRKPFSSVNRSSSNLLELIDFDVCDLNGKITRGGKRYFITFIDDLSKYAYIYLIRTKDKALDMFKIYKAEVENILGCMIKSLRSDRSREYFNNDFDNLCEINGIIHKRITPHTLQQNSVRERKNRTLMVMDMVNIYNAQPLWFACKSLG
jgi:transposase InsO family protein